MSRGILVHLNKTSGNLTKVNTGDKVEFFHTSSYAHVSAAVTTVNLRTRDRGGFPLGANLYVGTNATAVTIIGADPNHYTGQGTLTLGTSIVYAQYSSISLKSTGGAVAYAPVYADPDLQTPISQPITVNADNETRLYMRAGRYGMRWQDSSGNILDHDHDFALSERGGVSVTPGHNSDTAGIQEALNKMPPEGGECWIPAGTYTISDGFKLPAGTHLKGAGREIVKIIAKAGSVTSTGGGWVTKTNGAAGMCSVDTKLTGCIIEGITFDGNRENFTSQTIGVHIWNSDNCVVRDCRFQNISSVGKASNRGILVNSDGTNENIDIYQNEFVTIGDSVKTASLCVTVSSTFDRARISHNVFDCTKIEALVDFIKVGSTVAGDNSNAIIIGNEIRNFETGTALGAVGARGISVNRYRDVIISGNSIDSTEGDMINVQDSINATVMGNTCKRGREGGIDFSGVINGTINNNVVIEVDNGGVTVGNVSNDLTARAMQNVTVMGNTCMDNNQAAGSNMGGIAFRATDDNTTACKNVIISGNICGDSRSGGSRTSKYGIHVFKVEPRTGGADPAFEDFIISNNICFNNTADGIRILHCSGMTIQNNTVIDSGVYGININNSSTVLCENNRIARSGTQDIITVGTGLNNLTIGFNSIPGGPRTSMEGTFITTAGSPSYGSIPQHATGKNPYINSGAKIQFAYVGVPGNESCMQPVVRRIADGTCQVRTTIDGHTDAASTIYWRINKIGRTL